jgi:hypothetical protein
MLRRSQRLDQGGGMDLVVRGVEELSFGLKYGQAMRSACLGDEFLVWSVHEEDVLCRDERIETG